MAAGLPPVPALDQTISPGQSAHVDDHEVIAGTLALLKSAAGMTPAELAAEAAFTGTFETLAHAEDTYRLRTTERVIMAGQLGPAAGSPSYLTNGKNPSWGLDAAAAEAVGGVLLDLPPEWVGQTMTVEALINPDGSSTTDAKAVVLRLNYWTLVENATAGGTDPAAPTSAGDVTVNLPNGASTWLQWVELGSFTVLSAGHMFRVLRMAADAADTYASDLNIAAVRLTVPL